DLWLQLAGDANARAAELARAIQQHPQAGLRWPVEANEVFMKLDAGRLAELKNRGFEFHIWPGHDDLARLVCSFATTSEQVAEFVTELFARQPSPGTMESGA
ncbi:MAG: hypothetical protein RQ741_04740, partial [Wenzhouxiangellaceae bacterium]|nr:hypothetical protein [Wenzhouxiangellaceae bacterium]